ncbi:MAG TPA: hypothetical protein DCY57_08605 [Bacteroidetes bacterium]|nr:hypothetical protein [Bacteroidota bacterium]
MITSRIARWNLIAISVLLLLFFFWIDPTGRTPGWARFFARAHPALVHAPIGILIFGLVLEFLKGVGWLKEGDNIINIALILASWGALKSVAAGLWLGQMGGYPTEVLFLHKMIGMAITLLAAILLYVRVEMPKRSLVFASWFCILVGMTAAGEIGGKMTHGDGFSSEYAPGFVQAVIGDFPDPMSERFDLSDAAMVSVFESIVLPILNEKCASCHGADRGKGRLRLHSEEAISAHDGDEPLLVAGKPNESLLIQRITLPDGHEDQMPPPFNAKPISHADVELLKWWIANGASFDQAIAEMDMSLNVRTILSAYGLGAIRSGVFALDVPMPDSLLVAQLEADGAWVKNVAESEPFLEIKCDDIACLGSSAIDSLTQQIISIDISGSNVTDQEVSQMGRFQHLTRLDLSRTSINGSGLSGLINLEFLEYLNVYDTQTNDEALEHIKPMKSIAAVYLWQTAATPEGLEALQNALPNVEVNAGK